MADSISEDIDALVEKQKTLNQRLETLETQKAEITSELSARRKVLRKYMDECQAEGFDPNNIKDQLSRIVEVERVKQETLASEIESAEKMMKPMIDEIRKG